MNSIWPGVRQQLRDDLPILMPLAAISIGMLILVRNRVSARLDPVELNLQLYCLTLGLGGVAALAIALRRERPSSPFAYLTARLAHRDFAESIARGLPMLSAMILFVPIFSVVKSSIPELTGYSWDPALIAADRAILGTDAWRVLQPALGHPQVSAALSYLYHLWVLLIYLGGVYVCFFVKDRTLRAQYFIARFAIWIVMGLGIAMTFASVGPCFVGPLFGNHTFDAQMAYLRHANAQHRILVLPVQAELLAHFRAHSATLGAGISAMPSLHVAMAMLSALAARRLSRVAGGLLFGFTFLIFLGSIHLGYHYAVDGLVGASMTAALWLAAGVLARRIIRRADQADGARGSAGTGALAATPSPY